MLDRAFSSAGVGPVMLSLEKKTFDVFFVTPLPFILRGGREMRRLETPAKRTQWLKLLFYFKGVVFLWKILVFHKFEVPQLCKSGVCRNFQNRVCTAWDGWRKREQDPLVEHTPLGTRFVAFFFEHNFQKIPKNSYQETEGSGEWFSRANWKRRFYRSNSLFPPLNFQHTREN